MKVAATIEMSAASGELLAAFASLVWAKSTRKRTFAEGEKANMLSLMESADDKLPNDIGAKEWDNMKESLDSVKSFKDAFGKWVKAGGMEEVAAELWNSYLRSKPKKELITNLLKAGSPKASAKDRKDGMTWLEANAAAKLGDEKSAALWNGDASEWDSKPSESDDAKRPEPTKRRAAKRGRQAMTQSALDETVKGVNTLAAKLFANGSAKPGVEHSAEMTEYVEKAAVLVKHGQNLIKDNLIEMKGEKMTARTANAQAKRRFKVDALHPVFTENKFQLSYGKPPGCGKADVILWTPNGEFSSKACGRYQANLYSMSPLHATNLGKEGAYTFQWRVHGGKQPQRVSTQKKYMEGQKRKHEKVDKILAIGKQEFTNRWRKNLKSKDIGKRSLAAAMETMFFTGFRPGTEKKAAEDGGVGLMRIKNIKKVNGVAVNLESKDGLANLKKRTAKGHPVFELEYRQKGGKLFTVKYSKEGLEGKDKEAMLSLSKHVQDVVEKAVSVDDYIFPSTERKRKYDQTVKPTDSDSMREESKRIGVLPRYFRALKASWMFMDLANEAKDQLKTAGVDAYKDKFNAIIGEVALQLRHTQTRKGEQIANSTITADHYIAPSAFYHFHDLCEKVNDIPKEIVKLFPFLRESAYKETANLRVVRTVAL